KAVTDGDEGGIGIKLEFDCAACALSRVLLYHVLDLLFNWQVSVALVLRKPSASYSSFVNRELSALAIPLIGGTSTVICPRAVKTSLQLGRQLLPFLAGRYIR